MMMMMIMMIMIDQLLYTCIHYISYGSIIALLVLYIFIPNHLYFFQVDIVLNTVASINPFIYSPNYPFTYLQYIYIYYIGSGKTYTMSSIYEATCDDIFNYLNSTVDRFNTKLPTVTMSFFEIAGDNCHDLLNQFHPTQLLSCSDGNVHAYPLTEPKVTVIAI